MMTESAISTSKFYWVKTMIYYAHVIEGMGIVMIPEF